MRGGERVLEILCDGFPAAPIHTLICNRSAISDTITRHPIHTSWLQSVPGIAAHYRKALPLFVPAVRALRPAPADLLISTSHCVAKGTPIPKGTRHLCYCFTPMRYAWTFYEEYFGTSPLKALLVKPLLAHLRAWDRRVSRQVDRHVAISRHVQARIRDFYGMDSDIVYPPIDTDYWTPSPTARQSFDLIVSALVPYKRVDLAVKAYARSGHPLKIVGVGSGLSALQRLATPNIEFLGWRPDAEIRDLYRAARLLIFAGEEDFGLVPLEAQACGCPVVAFARGGALETVIADQTGIFFHEPAESALAAAVATAATRRWDAGTIRSQAEHFDIQSFIDGLDAVIARLMSGATDSRAPAPQASGAGTSRNG